MEGKNLNNQDGDFKKTLIFASLITVIIIVSIGVVSELNVTYENEPVVVYKLLNENTKENNGTIKGTFETDLSDNDNSKNSEYEENVILSVPPTETSDDAVITVVFPLDVNSASVEELMMVRGIGEITANKIARYRGINGYFYSMDELLNVDGIGQKKLDALDGYLFIDYDSLPETLPNSLDPERYDETEVNAITTVPPAYSEETAVCVTPTVTTEEFIMETEEFVTDLSDEFDTDIVNTEYEYSDLYLSEIDLFTGTETEYSPNFPIELNSADARDLTYIKGIGESTANKIVEYAKSVGFVSVDDLLNVSGIGQSKLEMIRPYVYVIPVNVNVTVTDTLTQTPIETSAEIYRVNINTGNKNDFMQLPGIDESLADEIINFRNTIGYFKNIEELSFVISNDELSDIWNYVYT